MSRVKLGYTVLSAPVSGVVLVRQAELGVPLVVSFYGYDATHLAQFPMWRRRFARLVKESPRSEDLDSPWPDLVILDGGLGQLNAAREILADLGISDLCVAAIAKGADREAGRETFHLPGRPPFRLPPRDPVLYFIQRLRDEAHRFAIGAHRQKRAKNLVTSTLDDVPGVGPGRKRALLMHFGTARAVKAAALEDLEKVPGISRTTARGIYDYFHPGG